MEKHELLSSLIVRARLNNDVVSEIIDALDVNSHQGITSVKFVLHPSQGEPLFVLERNVKMGFSFTPEAYLNSRQDVLNILGYHGYEIIEGKDRTDPNKPLVTIIVKPIRELVSGRTREEGSYV